MVQLLLDNGADVNLLDAVSTGSWVGRQDWGMKEVYHECICVLRVINFWGTLCGFWYCSIHILRGTEGQRRVYICINYQRTLPSVIFWIYNENTGLNTIVNHMPSLSSSYLTYQDGNTALLKSCIENRGNVARTLCEYRMDANTPRVDMDKANKVHRCTMSCLCTY